MIREEEVLRMSHFISLSHRTACQFTSWQHAQSEKHNRIPGSVGPAAFTMEISRKVLYSVETSLHSCYFSEKLTLERKVKTGKA